MKERIYSDQHGHWFYRARGNSAIGPFDSYSLAEQALRKRFRSWGEPRKPLAAWAKPWHPLRRLRRSATRQT